MDNRLFFMLSKTKNMLTVYIKHQLSRAELRVSPGQLGILFLLKEMNNRTMSELSTALETDNSAVTRTVDRLEKYGFVKRQLNANDRREYHIVITEPGIIETEKARAVIDAVNNKMESEFSDSEIKLFMEVMTKMDSVFKIGQK